MMKTIRNTLLALSFAAMALAAANAAETVGHKPFHSDIECAACHGKTENGVYTAPKREACLACHGPVEKLVESTKGLAMNPHVSPHWGTDADCSFCHKEHQASKNVCAYCHPRIEKTMP